MCGASGNPSTISWPNSTSFAACFSRNARAAAFFSGASTTAASTARRVIGDTMVPSGFASAAADSRS